MENYEENYWSGEESEGDSRIDGNDDDDEQESDLEFPEKKKKPGIIYLSSVPEGMSVGAMVSYFAQFGQVGRTYLVPVTTGGGFQTSQKNVHKCTRFSEGWIEFMSKKIAKRVAEQINCTQVGGKNKRAKRHSILWNIKYLPRFKWHHLSERLKYEKAAKEQQMRVEVSQVKKEAEHFEASVRRAKKRKVENTEEGVEKEGKRPFYFMQENPKGQGESYESIDDVKQKSKKTKKGRKSKEKTEEISSSPAPRKSTKSAKSKKGAKNNFIERSPSSAKKSKRSPAKSDKGQGSAMRRRSGDTLAAGSGGTERSTFLKSLFGSGS